jgi:hypothetical protein
VGKFWRAPKSKVEHEVSQGILAGMWPPPQLLVCELRNANVDLLGELIQFPYDEGDGCGGRAVRHARNYTSWYRALPTAAMASVQPIRAGEALWR